MGPDQMWKKLGFKPCGNCKVDRHPHQDFSMAHASKDETAVCSQRPMKCPLCEGKVYVWKYATHAHVYEHHCGASALQRPVEDPTYVAHGNEWRKLSATQNKRMFLLPAEGFSMDGTTSSATATSASSTTTTATSAATAGEAGARTAAPAQEAGSSTAQREKRQETAIRIPTWQWNMMTFGPFSRPICCDSSSRDWRFPGRSSPEFHQKVSKVEHIAPACCQQALKPTLLHKVL